MTDSETINERSSPSGPSPASEEALKRYEMQVGSQPYSVVLNLIEEIRRLREELLIWRPKVPRDKDYPEGMEPVTEQNLCEWEQYFKGNGFSTCWKQEDGLRLIAAIRGLWEWCDEYDSQLNYFYDTKDEDIRRLIQLGREVEAMPHDWWLEHCYEARKPEDGKAWSVVDHKNSREWDGDTPLEALQAAQSKGGV